MHREDSLTARSVRLTLSLTASYVAVYMRQGELVRAMVILSSSLYAGSVSEEGERVRSFA